MGAQRFPPTDHTQAFAVRRGKRGLQGAATDISQSMHSNSKFFHRMFALFLMGYPKNAEKRFFRPPASGSLVSNFEKISKNRTKVKLLSASHTFRNLGVRNKGSPGRTGASRGGVGTIPIPEQPSRPQQSVGQPEVPGPYRRLPRRRPGFPAARTISGSRRDAAGRRCPEPVPAKGGPEY